MAVDDKNMPQITKAAYIAVREAFRKSLPTRVSPTWIMANIAGYKAQGSARTLARYLGALGLIDSEGSPTEVAKKWRIDESYAEACESILRSGFPADVVDAVPNDGSTEVLVNLFMTRGLGEGSAKNLASIYRFIASKLPPEARGSKSNPSSNAGARSKPIPRTSIATSVAYIRSSVPADSVDQPALLHETGVTVLRYFLDRGRLAEIRIPKDLDDREKRKLFAHLKIDLLDEVIQ
jgi:hypothetical protein